MMSTHTSRDMALAISTACWAATDRPLARVRTSRWTSSQPGEDGLGLAVHSAPADHDPSVPVAHEDVLGDIEVGIDRRLLVDGGDPVPLRVGRAAQRDLLPVDEDRPR